MRRASRSPTRRRGTASLSPPGSGTTSSGRRAGRPVAARAGGAGLALPAGLGNDVVGTPDGRPLGQRGARRVLLGGGPPGRLGQDDVRGHGYSCSVEEVDPPHASRGGARPARG